MGNIKERVAYLQGLTQGLNVNAHSVEGKILLNIIDVLDDMADEFTTMQLEQKDLETYVESMDEDLSDLEEEVYDENQDDSEYVQVQCPACHETVSFETHILEEEDIEVSCPQCGEIVYDSAFSADVIDVSADTTTSSSGNPLRYGLHPGI